MHTRDLEFLLAVNHSGSLSRAAKCLGVATSTIGRRLSALEAMLNLELIERRTDGVTLTEDGKCLVDLATDVVTSAKRLTHAATGLHARRDRETVRVSATEFVVSDVLAPALNALRVRHPTVNVVLRAQPDVVSLATGEADIAVRMSRLEGNSLIVRKVADLRLGLFAGERYLAGREPARLDLSQERLLGYDDGYGPVPEVTWTAASGREGAMALRTNSTRGLLMAACAGAGIALLPRVFALRAGLVEVPAPFDLPARRAWIVSHRDLRRRPAIKAVHAWIVGAFADLH